MPHFVYSQLKETGQICHLGGISDSAFHGVVLDVDEVVHTVRTISEVIVFLLVESTVQAGVHGRIVGTLEDIQRRESVRTADCLRVCDRSTFCGGNTLNSVILQYYACQYGKCSKFCQIESVSVRTPNLCLRQGL